MPTTAPEQCVILVGGRGTRLGELAASTPKPLIEVGGRPFLLYLLREAARFGFRRIVLLAGYRADAITDFVDGNDELRSLGLEITVAREETPLGTGGALRRAADALDPQFLLLNGDSWFDFNWLEVCRRGLGEPTALVALALRRVADAGRYGVVDWAAGRVNAFHERGFPGAPGLVNGGVYFCRKDLIAQGGQGGSLEQNILPALAKEGRIVGDEYQGFFIDIGVPESLAAAQSSVPPRFRRPAAVLDYDGVFKHRSGIASARDEFVWVEGGVEAVRRLNATGYYVFVVGVPAPEGAPGYSVAASEAFMHRMAFEMRGAGGHIDDWQRLPSIAASDAAIRDLLRTWPVAEEGSFRILGRSTDGKAGEPLMLPCYDNAGANLDRLVEKILLARPPIA